MQIAVTALTVAIATAAAAKTTITNRTEHNVQYERRRALNAYMYALPDEVTNQPSANIAQ